MAARLAIPIVILIAVGTCISDAAGAPAFPDPVSKTASAAAGQPPREMIIAGFHISGTSVWQKLVIPDIDLITEGTTRYLPFFRLVKALEVEHRREGQTLVLLREGKPYGLIDLELRRALTVGGESAIEPILARSDITGEDEVFLPLETLGFLLGFKADWDQSRYEVVASATTRFPVWRTMSTAGFAGVAAEVPMGVPEMHGPSSPPRFSLDYLQFRLLQVTEWDSYLKTFDSRIDTIQESVWGRAFGGGFFLQLNQQPVRFAGSESRAVSFSPLMLGRAEWRYPAPGAEIVAGDSVAGVSGLIFPALSIAGLQIRGGSLPRGGEERRPSISGAGISSANKKALQGDAPVNSLAELFINGRKVDEQRVLGEPGSASPTGSYRFNDLTLPAGALTETEIVITDPEGRKSATRNVYVGTVGVLPRGDMAYSAFAGTTRDVGRWRTYGVVAGGTILYGVSDAVTVGGSAACQNGLYSRVEVTGGRPFPRQSFHLGAKVVAKPVERLVVTGEAALSRTEGDDLLAGSALRLQIDSWLRNDLSVVSRYTRYGSDYFDGQNITIHDREGYFVSARWTRGTRYRLLATTGHAEGTASSGGKTSADFQGVEASSSAIPGTTLTAGIERMDSDAANAEILYLLKVQMAPLPDLSVEGTFVEGESGTSGEIGDITAGLGIPWSWGHLEPSTTAIVQQALPAGNSVGLAFERTHWHRRASVLHSLSAGGFGSLQLRTEAGWDLDSNDIAFRNNTHYYFPGGLNRSIQLQTRLEKGEWRVMLAFNLTETFSFYHSGVRMISDRSISPMLGAIHGKVFVDYNGDGLLDEDEPGLENVTVVVGRQRIVTDGGGYFVASGTMHSQELRAALDMKTVPAIYAATHGKQGAAILPWGLTEVNLGVIPVVSIQGRVMVKRDGSTKPLPGVRVRILEGSDRKEVGNSVTAGDGSYYLNEVKPGRYLVVLDESTLPVTGTYERELEVAPTREPLELTLPEVIVAEEESPGNSGG